MMRIPEIEEIRGISRYNEEYRKQAYIKETQQKFDNIVSRIIIEIKNAAQKGNWNCFIETELTSDQMVGGNIINRLQERFKGYAFWYNYRSCIEIYVKW